MWSWLVEACDRNVRELNLNPNDRRLVPALKLAQRLEGAPRHPRQCPGGIVLTHDSSTIWCRTTVVPIVSRQVV